ncbi:MAG TPA: protein-glutamate O-methyltransferase CheR, partial [Allocoleopsis sp.]
MEKIREIISNKTGWLIRENDQESLAQKIAIRLHELKLSDVENYYKILESETAISQQEWEKIAMMMTIPESYLFRDQGQISLLKTRILPELIQKNQEQKKLRIWSAGCSTGEEPFTIAIILKQLIPDIENWDILILGTDINPEVIKKAKIGAYNSWSFRSVDAEIKKSFFHHQGTEWYIDEQIRRLVKFEIGNLMADKFPNHTSEMNNMDLIICRNVFIYFEQTAILSVVEKFYQTLKPNGYLITGHAEVLGENLGNFKVNIFPESIIYKRQENLEQNVNQVVNLLPKQPEQKMIFPQIDLGEKKPIEKSFQPLVKTEKKPDIFQLLMEVKELFKQKKYPAAMDKNQLIIKHEPNNFAANYLMAEIYANLANYNQAVYYCNLAIVINSLAV